MEASAAGVNAPHVNDADPDDFFGDEEATNAEEPTAEAEVTGDGSGEALPPVEPEAPETPAEPEPPAQVPATATAAGRAAAAEAPAPPASPPVEDPPAPVEDPPAADEQATKASKDRPYVVLRELKLDEETLTKLLEHVRSGADPIDVFLHVETVEARNDQHALKQVYARHRDRIGDRPRLVPVSKRAWRVRQVQPRQRVEEAVEIT
jgi:hypothetical protein